MNKVDSQNVSKIHPKRHAKRSRHQPWYMADAR